MVHINLKTKIELLPQSPGVYKFLNKEEEILYIGKATNLKVRVKSYFSSTLHDRPKIKQMIPHISDISVIETNNEIESLVLESALIKQYQPFYNSDQKDDKSYVWIYISTKDKFPTVKTVRKINTKEMKRGELFGPYPSSSATKRIYTYLRKLYPFCTCKKESSKECLYFHLGLCPGPYQGHISEEEYRKNINEIIKFLRGRKRGQIKEMEKKMRQYSKEEKFEEALLLRDKISDLKYLGEKVEYFPKDPEHSYTERRKKLLLNQFEQLRKELGIKNLNRVECYDISDIQGKFAYGAMVVAVDGEIDRNEYRIFKIEGIEQADDFGMLKQVLQRRFDQKNSLKYPTLPDIILIDGGKSHLSSLMNDLRGALPKETYLIAISEKNEFWVVNTEKKVVQIDLFNKELLVDLRDEAHRFALLHHRKARLKGQKNSELEKIPGVGRKRRKQLLLQFKNIDSIKNATLKEINSVIRNKKVSEKIVTHFNKNPHCSNKFAGSKLENM